MHVFITELCILVYDSYSFIATLQLALSIDSNLNEKMNIISVHYIFYLTLVNQYKVLAHPSGS